VLALPDVHQLVRYELLVGLLEASSQEDRAPDRVALKAPKPRQAEKHGCSEDPYARQIEWARIERKRLDAPPGTLDCLLLGLTLSLQRAQLTNTSPP
jgi:hypothetical protein